MKKRLEGAALKILPELTRSWPCKAEFRKNDFELPANFLFAACIPQNVIKLHQLFNICNTNTHFDMFLLKNKGNAMYGYYIFLGMC